jgi:hypothetical protein
MSTLKFTCPEHWNQIEDHLACAKGERFAFAFTRQLSDSDRGPVLEVVDIALSSDADVRGDRSGWYLSDEALDRVHNKAIESSTGLAEFHNHCLGPPGFSRTDEAGLGPMAEYMLDLLPGRPYVAAVWAQGQLHCEWWRVGNGAHVVRTTFDTVTVGGDHLRVLGAGTQADIRFDRQLPLIGQAGQASLAALRIAVVGAGGTGSQVLTGLSYMGARNLRVYDDDLVEESNLNRLVTADFDDIGVLKTEVAQRRIRRIDPRIGVNIEPAITVGSVNPELYDSDLIIGCLDHDGPRQRLNQIAVETGTPYVDIATGVDDTTSPPLVGGRVIFWLPGSPCLTCLGELDPAEVSRWAKPEAQQLLDREHGYGTGRPNPSVVQINALTCSAAINEISCWISGHRAPVGWLDIDMNGAAGSPGTWVTPRRLRPRDPACITCSPSP